MTVSEGQTLGALALLMVLIAVHGISSVSARQTGPASAIPLGRQGPGMMAIAISGDPESEGVYFLPSGTTLEKLLETTMISRQHKDVGSGGRTMTSGSHITISSGGEPGIGKMDVTMRLALDLPVEVNGASVADLALIPGIGEKLAYEIVALRKQKGAFHDLADLMEVPGIKAKKLDALKRYLTTGDVPG